MIWVLRNWKAIAAAAAICGAIYGLWQVFGYIGEVKALRASVGEKTAQIEAMRKGIENAEREAQKYEAERAIVAADLAVTDGQLDRLRADIAAIGSDSSAPSSTDAARIAGILGECAGEVVRLAGAADDLAAKLTAWQAWAKGVGMVD